MTAGRTQSTLGMDGPNAEPSTSTIRVLLVGGHKLERDGLALLLATEVSLRVISDGDDPRAAFDQVSGPAPEVVLLDIDRAPQRARQTLAQLKELAADARLVVLTGSTDRGLAGQLVLDGARGVVSKDRSAVHLLDAIRKVHEGELWVDRATTAEIIAGLTDKGSRQAGDPQLAKVGSLTPREREVIALVAKGHSNKAIAERMMISGNTVRHHLTSIFSKLEITDRLALVVYSFHHRIG